MSLTDFQKCAANAIASVGGVIYYEGQSYAKDGQGRVLQVLNPDGCTFGHIGWPTINMLCIARKLQQVEGNKYQLVGKQ